MAPRASTSPLLRRLLPVAAVAAAVLLGFLLWRLAFRSPGGDRLPRDLNVILVTIDTLRADYVGAYRGGRAATPALDALAASGALFERCIAPAPLTLPSHTSLLSATQPLFHRVRDNGGFRVPAGLQLLSEVLGERGFATAAFIGAYVLHGKWGLNQGFDHYADRFGIAQGGRITLQNEKRAAEVLEEARGWLTARPANRPFFAWIHLYDPHAPYDPPSPFAERCNDDRYRGEVEYTDAQLGRFVDFLKEKGLFDRTLLVVAADHGEGLGDHGEAEHGLFVYETTVRVPLLIRAPVAFAATRVSETVQLIDVAPTIVDLLGVPAPRQWQGRSLRRLLAGEADGRFGQAYSETWYPRLHFGWAPLQALTSGPHKYILAPRDELYDLADDPGETRDRKDDPRRRDLRARLLAYADRHARGALASEGGGAMSPADRQRLAALGYLSGTAQVSGAGPLPDPKDKRDVFDRMLRASALLNQGRHEEAVALLRSITAAEPELGDAWSALGNALYALGRHAEALQANRRALQLKPDNNFVMLNILTVMTDMGDPGGAWQESERFLRAFPGDAALLESQGHIRFLQGRYDEAVALLRRAYTADPGAVQAYNLAGEALLRQGRHDAALETLRQGLRQNPQARNTHYLLAQVHEARGERAPAVENYRLELQGNPDKLEAAYNLANLLKQSGELAEAAEWYRKVVAAQPEMKRARFHLAEIMLQRGEDLPAAVRLCLEGIAVPPRDRDTLFGYYLLTNLYAALGDPANVQRFTREGEQLIAALERRP